MAAFIVDAANLGTALAVEGASFSVGLSPDGQEPATHFGCNWTNIPSDAFAILSALPGMVVANDDNAHPGAQFSALCASVGVQPFGD